MDDITQDNALRFATGDEELVSFGSDLVEQPMPREVVFVEGNSVLTHRWTWL